MKEHTVKDYQQRINQVLLYIQQHYLDDLSLQELAEVANFSSCHFQRIFQAFIGESVYAHVRRLRLQYAASELVYTPKTTITDVALNARFENSSSFAKAFKQCFGLTPRQFRQRGTMASYCNPNVKIKSLSEDSKMKVNYKKLEPQTALFVRRTGSYFDSAPSAWLSLMDYVKEHDLFNDHNQYIGIAHDDPAITNEEHIRFDACITGIADPKADGEVGVQTIAGGQYAVFEHHGSYETCGDTYRKIFGQWLPQSGRSLRNVPTFAIYQRERRLSYIELSDEEKSKLVTEIYVPIEE